MLGENPIIRGVKGVEYTTMSKLIEDFRKTIEHEAGPIQNVDLNGALFLSDLCKFLGFSDELRDKVVGKSAASWIQEILREPISIPTKH